MKFEERASSEELPEADADYRALMTRAREVLEADSPPPASSWVRIREGIDAGIDARASSGMAWAWGAALVAGAAALVLSISPLSMTPVPERAVAEAVQTARTVGAAAPAEARPEVAALSPSVQVGDVLSAVDGPKVLQAFDRHRLTLAAGSSMEVVAWSERDLSVRLLSGHVDADIAKAYPGERVEILTSSATVRVVGTQFRVALDAEGSTEVSVTEGIVAVYRGRDLEAAPERVTAGKVHRVTSELAAKEAPSPSAKRPTRSSKPPRASKRPATRKGGADKFRLIEIDVPPQQAPNAR